MITADGWLSWAERVPGHPEKVNGGVNPATGFVAHSAEGWEPALRALVADINRRASWHFSNLRDGGRLLQHFPLQAQCWASGSSYPNNNMVAMEHEGIAGQPLTDAQVATTVRVIREVSRAFGWKPRRPTDGSDRTATLWEHREMTRFGSDPTDCPSERIRWTEILAQLEEEENDMMQPFNGIASFFELRDIEPGSGYTHIMQVRSDFQLPVAAKMVRLDVYLGTGGPLTIRHPSGLVAGVMEAGERHAQIDVEISLDGTCGFDVASPVTIRRIGCLGLWL